MKTRFEGDEGSRRLIAAFQRQKITAGDKDIASILAIKTELVEFKAGQLLIEEGASDTDIYFILAGTVSILVKGRSIAQRSVNDHVGELAAIDPSLPRSATVIANELCLTAKISEPDLTTIAIDYPNVWRNFAVELAQRLAQRNTLIVQPNDKPRIFIISSKESLSIAQEIQSIMHHEFLVDVWTDGVFFASSYVLEVLEKAIERSDFAIAVAQPDDEIISRGVQQLTPRDNVIFELGLFMGRLGRRRTILFQPAGKELKLPSDLKGLTAVSYKTGSAAEMTALLAPACHEVRKLVHELGVKN